MPNPYSGIGKLDTEKLLKLEICAITWNVASGFPSTAKEVEDALKSDSRTPGADIYVISLQEVVHLNPLNVTIAPHHAAKPWEDAFEDVLIKNGRKYAKICLHQLVGIVLLVYVRYDLFPYISEYQHDKLGIGMGRLGNKGAVAFRFRLFHATFVCIASHLSPHKENYSKRNKNYLDICENICFFDSSFTPNNIFDCDVLIWAGDLNYRVEFPIEDSDAMIKVIDSGEYTPLLAKDQLIAAMTEGTAFSDMSEAGEIKFPPTFKLVPDRKEAKYNAKRTPSWTDRILYRVRPKEGPRDSTVKSFTPMDYTCVSTAIHSDHRPVRALFELEMVGAQSGIHIGTGVLGIWTLLEVVQFFANVLQVNFHYTKDAYGQLSVHYLVGWSIGGIPNAAFSDSHPRPDVSTLVGMERLSWELGIDPNNLAFEAFVNFLLAAAAAIGAFGVFQCLTYLFQDWVNALRTTQAHVYPRWVLFKVLTIIFTVALFPCFALGSFHMSFCFRTSGYHTPLRLTEADCAGGTFVILMFFIAYCVMMYYLWSKVSDLKSYVQLYSDGRSKALWGHFWVLYRFPTRWFALVDMTGRILSGIVVGSSSYLSYFPLCVILFVQSSLLVVVFRYNPYINSRTGIFMKLIYSLRVGLLALMLLLEASAPSAPDIRSAVSWLIIVSYFLNIVACVCFFMWHQGRSAILDFVSYILPCLRGRLTRLLAWETQRGKIRRQGTHRYTSVQPETKRGTRLADAIIEGYQRMEDSKS
ncbi:hypothetical protein AAMO2058_001702900 [Amorphochlora amoebiformis]